MIASRLRRHDESNRGCSWLSLLLLLLACGCEPFPTWRATWTIALGGVPATCEQAGATAAGLAAQRLESGAVLIAERGCSGGLVITSRLDVGELRFELDLLGSDASVIATAPLGMRRVTGVDSLDLGVATLDPATPPAAQAALFIGYGAAFGQLLGCGPVEEERLSLTDASGQPATAILRLPSLAGGETLPDSSLPHPCPGPRQIQILDGLLPGTYAFHAEGLVAGVTCYVADGMITTARGSSAASTVAVVPVSPVNPSCPSLRATGSRAALAHSTLEH